MAYSVFGLLLDLSVRGPFGVNSHYFPLQRRMISPLSALDADAVGARMTLCTSICSQSLPFFASSFSALHPAITRRGRSSHALTIILIGSWRLKLRAFQTWSSASSTGWYIVRWPSFHAHIRAHRPEPRCALDSCTQLAPYLAQLPNSQVTHSLNQPTNQSITGLLRWPQIARWHAHAAHAECLRSKPARASLKSVSHLLPSV